MPRPLFAAILVVAAVLAACRPAADAPDPSPTPSGPVTTPMPQASGDPSPSLVPTEDPTASPIPVPTEATFTPDEQALVDGIRRGATACEPVRDGLPNGAMAGIECASDDPAIARVGLYRFADEAAALDAYLARMAAEGVELESGACIDGEGEGSYVPFEDGISPMRNGCFINDQGYANFRATLGGGLYVGVLGTTDDMVALVDFAWAGNEDVPGTPTLWADAGPESD